VICTAVLGGAEAASPPGPGRNNQGRKSPRIEQPPPFGRCPPLTLHRWLHQKKKKKKKRIRRSVICTSAVLGGTGSQGPGSRDTTSKKQMGTESAWIQLPPLPGRPCPVRSRLPLRRLPRCR
jgi:hypothetical protein